MPELKTLIFARLHRSILTPLYFKELHVGEVFTLLEFTHQNSIVLYEKIDIVMKPENCKKLNSKDFLTLNDNDEIFKIYISEHQTK